MVAPSVPGRREDFFLNYRRIVPTRLVNGGVCPAWFELG